LQAGLQGKLLRDEGNHAGDVVVGLCERDTWLESRHAAVAEPRVTRICSILMLMGDATASWSNRRQIALQRRQQQRRAGNHTPFRIGVSSGLSSTMKIELKCGVFSIRRRRLRVAAY